MEYRKSRQVLKQVMRGVPINPYDRKVAASSVRFHRELVPCSNCKVNRMMRYQRDKGYHCYWCSMKGN